MRKKIELNMPEIWYILCVYVPLMDAREWRNLFFIY